VGTGGVVLELEPVAAISFVEEIICARAAAVGEETAVQWRSLTQCSNGGDASRRCLRPSLVIGIRVVGGETGGSGKPHIECPSPHLSFICAVRRGAASHRWAGRPQSGREFKAKKTVEYSMDRRSV
jgi:hypothetical protein